jgi:hypothetical protein
MAMNANVLGDAIMAAEDAVYNSYISETTDPINHAAYRQARYRALAQTIISHINTYAEVASLTVNNTPMDGAAHTHSPALTSAATGKIS